MLGSSCFSCCKPLSSISFESNSRLIRIESNAFAWSSLESIEIPRNVQFIDDSTFACTTCNHISIEAGHERFAMNVQGTTAVAYIYTLGEDGIIAARKEKSTKEDE
jgi:hypothetical protein